MNIIITALCLSVLPLQATPPENCLAVAAPVVSYEEWSNWSPVDRDHDYIEFRWKIDNHNMYGKYLWHVQFRNTSNTSHQFDYEFSDRSKGRGEYEGSGHVLLLADVANETEVTALLPSGPHDNRSIQLRTFNHK